MNKVDIHKQLCDGLNELYAAKNHDYGDSAAKTRKIIPHACLIRLHDKLNRLTTLMTSGDPAKVKDESIDDNLLDIANYALMELVERRVDAGQPKSSPDPKTCPYFSVTGHCMGQKEMPECSPSKCPVRGGEGH